MGFIRFVNCIRTRLLSFQESNLFHFIFQISNFIKLDFLVPLIWNQIISFRISLGLIDFPSVTFLIKTRRRPRVERRKESGGRGNGRGRGIGVGLRGMMKGVFYLAKVIFHFNPLNWRKVTLILLDRLVITLSQKQTITFLYFPHSQTPLLWPILKPSLAFNSITRCSN